MDTSLPFMTSSDDCLTCAEGTFCPVGSANETACAPGTFNPTPEQDKCQSCEAGKYQDAEGSTACLDCTPGYYCAEGSAAPLPCPAGTHMNSSLPFMTTAEDCIVCAAGTACSVGSAHPVPCLPGSFASTPKTESCTLCEPGKFAGTAGNTACSPCTPGYLCVEGSAAPQPCPGGTHANQTILNLTGFLGSLDECISCPAGTACSVGSAEPKLCLPGSYGAEPDAETCTLCPEGKFTSTLGNTDCNDCTPGYLCVEGSSAPQPCRGGTHANQTVLNTTGYLSSLDQCIICPAGTSCSVGSAEPKLCLPGSFGATEEKESCELCPEGKFTSTLGNTECEDCTPGYLCIEGSSAPIPCRGGTHANQTVLQVVGYLSSLSQCIICPPGTSCSVGSAEPKLCLPGSYAPFSETEACPLCLPGEYQDLPGQTSCKPCTRGFYCEVGTAKPTPCPAGRASNASGLNAETGCVMVTQGYWAPLGSAVPEECPASGFYCPGAAEDVLYGGAKPIIMPVGGSTETEDVEVVEQEMTLTIDCTTFDLGIFKATLAEQYEVDVALIEVEDPCALRRRERRSLQQTVSITIAIASSGTAADGTPISAPVSELLDSLTNVADADLGTALGSALGTPITLVSAPPTSVNVTKTVQLDCPKGKWCTAGLVVDCPLNTYNNLTKQDFATACKLCPLNSHTKQLASTSLDDCLCNDEYFDEIIGPGVFCSLCPSGTSCNGGATLDRLPLQRSFYRLTNTTTDVMKCPDFDSNCSTTFGTDACSSTSACNGGTDVNDQCDTTRTGIKSDSVFCRTCAELPPGSEQVFYAPATDTSVAMCKPCGNSFVSSLLYVALIILGLSCVGFVAHFIKSRYPKKTSWFVQTFSVANKIKIMFTFYMVVTKIDNIYEVSMPAEVREQLERLSGWISFGLMGLSTTPLECMGLAGYMPKLFFWMFLPLACSALILAVVLVTRCGRRKNEPIIMKPTRTSAGHGGSQTASIQRDEQDLREQTLLESTLPPFLQVMFILYPNVTKTAFDGLSPCYELGDGFGGTRGFLIADVNIECRTPQHDQVKLLAWTAVIIYPVGLMVLNSLLLMKASKAIVAGSNTPLSRSIQFLFKEFNVTTFWWEIAEMLRKFLLVGIMVVIEPGTVTQLVLGTIISAVYLMIQLQAHPYKNKSDDYLAAASSFSMTMVFLCSIVYKYASLTDTQDVQAKMSSEQKADFLVPSFLISVILIASVFGSIIFAALILIVQAITEIRAQAKLRRIKYVASKKWVHCVDLKDPQAFHLFLSHAWPAAQDRMRIVKARFAEALPSARVFLDVDDLKSGSGTAEVDKSECILVFCTSQYFEKKNSLKELYRAVCQRRPILAMLEPDATQEGGLNQADVEALITNKQLDKFKLRKKWQEWKDDGDLLPAAFDHAPDEDEVRAALFAVPPVEWNRLPHFQDVTIRLIAQNGILHGKAGDLYLEGEAAMGKVCLPPPRKGRRCHLFCSPYNAGALELARELKDSSVWTINGKKPSAELSFTSDVKLLGECDHMLVLLDDRTWTSGESTAKFVEHIHVAMRKGVHLNCVHEFPSVVGPFRHECEFALMFSDDWTPSHLTGGQTNLYKEIALALKGVEWRQPGLVAMASKLVASAGEHRPITFEVPDTYEPKTAMDTALHHQDVQLEKKVESDGQASLMPAPIELPPVELNKAAGSTDDLSDRIKGFFSGAGSRETAPVPAAATSLQA